MGYERLPREYRMRPSRRNTFLVVIVVGTLVVMLPMLTADDLPAAFKYLFLLGWVALFGWLFYATLRCSTTANIKVLDVRGMIRHRRLAWEDIQDIRSEFSAAGAAQSGAASVLVHAYDRNGARVLLPFVDDIHVNVERELTLLLEAWQELRGEDWAPDPAAAVLIDRRDARQAALMAGFAAAMIAIIPLIFLMLLPLFVDLPEWLESILAPFMLMGVALPLIFVLTALSSYRNRRPSA